MFFSYENIKINYKKLHFTKENKNITPVLFLHGWGGSINSFLFCAKQLKNVPCILIDFPPFGYISFYFTISLRSYMLLTVGTQELYVVIGVMNISYFH